MGDFLDGIRAYAQAWRIIRDQRLWGYMLIPALISLLLFVGVFVLARTLTAPLTHYLENLGSIQNYVGSGLIKGIVFVVTTALLLALGTVLYKSLLIALAGPFMSPLSERVEQHLRGIDTPVSFSLTRMLGEIVRGLSIALRIILREIWYTLLLLLLGFVLPIVAPVIPVLIFLVQSYYAGFGNLDYAMERHFKVRDSVQFIRQNRGLALGNGLVFMLLLLTGVGVLLAPPLATVAATIETVRRMPEETV